MTSLGWFSGSSHARLGKPTQVRDVPDGDESNEDEPDKDEPQETGQTKTSPTRTSPMERTNPMEISGKTALVTGANRGFGRQLATQLRDRGATVYAAARNPAAVDLTGVTPIALDVTDPASVAAAAAATGDVAILINNAGSGTGASLLTGELDDVRLEMDTHFLGT